MQTGKLLVWMQSALCVRGGDEQGVETSEENDREVKLGRYREVRGDP